MVDQNQFINTYIDVIINTLQEHLKANLQLQTQVKVNEFVVAEKDKLIATLNEQITQNRVADDWKVKYESAETNYSAVLNKLKNMDALFSQVNDMKKMIVEKDAQISLLKEELDQIKNGKKVINTKTKKKEETESSSLVIVEEDKTKTLDDF